MRDQCRARTHLLPISPTSPSATLGRTTRAREATPTTSLRAPCSERVVTTSGQPSPRKPAATRRRGLVIDQGKSWTHPRHGKRARGAAAKGLNTLPLRSACAPRSRIFGRPGDFRPWSRSMQSGQACQVWYTVHAGCP